MNQILQVLSSAGRYGKENIVKSLCELSSDVLDIDSNPFFVKDMATLSNSRYYATLPELKRLIAAQRYKIIHTHDVKSNFYVRLYAKLSSMPILRTYHGYTHNTLLSKKGLYYLIDLMLKRTNTWNISVSFDNTADQVIYNGVSNLEECPTEISSSIMAFVNDPQRFIIGAIGRLSKEKNFENLLLGFLNTAHAQQKKVKLIIFGEGKDRASIEAIIHANAAQDIVLLPGFVSELPYYLKYCDLIIQPSLKEGMPCSALESALFSSATQLLSSAGELSTFVKNHYAYSIETDIDSITQTLTSFLNKMVYKRARENLSGYKRRRSDYFREYALASKNRMLNDYKEVYRRFGVDLN